MRVKKALPCFCAILMLTNITGIKTLAVSNGNPGFNVESFGGGGTDRYFEAKPTEDNGCIAVGNSSSSDAGFTNKGSDDATIVKYDEYDNKEWARGFGSSGSEAFNSVAVINDGGFVVVGNSTSYDAGFTNKGNGDAIIVKYSEDGVQQWIQSFGGKKWDYFHSITNTDDGGFVAAGYSDSIDAGFTNKGDNDGIIVKYNGNGSQQWIKSFGGSGGEYFYSIINTSDGGFVAAGYSNSTNAGFTNKGSSDAIIVKYDSNGNQQWVKNFGGSGNDYFRSIINVNDGGFIAVGDSNSTNAGFTNKGGIDAIIVKYDSNGNQQWGKNFGGSSGDYFYSLTAAEDNLIAVGNSTSTDAGFVTKGNGDGIVVIYDNSGNQQGVNNFGGSVNEYFKSTITTKNNRILIAGHSASKDANFDNKGSEDALLVEAKISKPSPPVIEFDSKKNTITIDSTAYGDDFKEFQYKINDEEWSVYNRPFEPIYDGNGICKIKVKSISVFGIESEVSVSEVTKLNETKDINVLFRQPHTLSVTLSSNAVDFGEITGIEDVEKNNTLTLTISSSTTYDIKVKAEDDIKGTADTSSIVDISKLHVSVNTNPYKVMSKNYIDLLKNNPKGLDITHSLNFKLESTLGIKSDSYSVPLKINVSQI